MILDALRIVAAWLADSTHGVDARLAALDLDAGDSAPSGSYTIGEETSDDAVAIGRFPAALPAIALGAQPLNVLERESATFTHDGEITLLIRVARSKALTSQAVRDTYYTLRALVQCLEDLMKDDNAASRTRNQVTLYAITDLSGGRVVEQLEDAVVTGALSVTFQARDGQAA